MLSISIDISSKMPSIYNGHALLERRAEAVVREFRISDEDLRNIITMMTAEMERGLKKHNTSQVEHCSSLKMLLSHINSIPKYTQEGCYLAIDLGGTNFRVLVAYLNEGNNASSRVRVVTEVFALPDDVMVDGETFFDHVANCIGQFCKLNGLSEAAEPVPLGFTFSFPLHQEHLSHAVLIDWAKGFDIDGVVGNDVVEMLYNSIAKCNDINCEIVAVVNDTVGTLVSLAHRDPTCKIGLIVGTGCNACYIEKMENVSGQTEQEGQMCINMEWGSFGDNGVLEEFRTEYDRQVDSSSNNPNGRTYEKMVSGRFLGEIVRLVLCKLVGEGVIFENADSEKLFAYGAFKTSFVYAIENTNTTNHFHGPYITVRNVLQSLGIIADDADCEVVKRLCEMVSSRAAHLCAAGVAAVALKIKANHPENEEMTVTVAVDGTVYKKHPTFSRLLREKTTELCDGSGVTVRFMPSYDGSGKGAAFVAAAMHHQKCLSAGKNVEKALLLPQT